MQSSLLPLVKTRQDMRVPGTLGGETVELKLRHGMGEPDRWFDTPESRQLQLANCSTRGCGRSDGRGPSADTAAGASAGAGPAGGTVALGAAGAGEGPGGGGGRRRRGRRRGHIGPVPQGTVTNTALSSHSH